MTALDVAEMYADPHPDRGDELAAVRGIPLADFECREHDRIGCVECAAAPVADDEGDEMGQTIDCRECGAIGAAPSRGRYAGKCGDCRSASTNGHASVDPEERWQPEKVAAQAPTRAASPVRRTPATPQAAAQRESPTPGRTCCDGFCDHLTGHVEPEELPASERALDDDVLPPLVYAAWQVDEAASAVEQCEKELQDALGSLAERIDRLRELLPDVPDSVA